MTFDPYSDSAASAAALIRKMFGCEYTDLFKGDPVVRLGQFSAMLDASQEQKWMSIDTAPKSGALIILGRAASAAHDRNAECSAGRWHEEEPDAQDNMGHDGGFMDVDFNGTFYVARSFGNPSYMTKGYQPTHWMPLPQPPVDSKLEDSNG